MKIRRRAWWLFVCSAIYVIAGFYDICTSSSNHLVLIQLIWIVIISTPLWIPPLGNIIFKD